MERTKEMLLVIDAQNGFIHDEATTSIIPRLNHLIEKFNSENIVFSRFINPHDSAWERLSGWKAMRTSPDIDLHPDLQIRGARILDKPTFSLWRGELQQLCTEKQVETFYICGLDTDQCVLATAIDIFSAGIRPVVVTDCCASSAGKDFHDAGLKLLERLIGRDQLMRSQDI